MTTPKAETADATPPGAPGHARPESRFFTHEQIMAVLPGLMLAMFLAALDQTIVAIALYTIAQDLQGEALMPWLVSGYLVVATVATPIYGKLSDLFGRWPVLSAAIFIYLLASLASTFAQNMPQLLAFRLIQGLGGGGLIVLVQTVVADIVERQNRGRYQAWLSGVFAVAAVTGPLLGGLLSQFVSWRAVFVLNVPLALIAWFILRRGLANLPRQNKRSVIDYGGAVLLSLTIGGLMLALLLIGQGHALTSRWPLAGFGMAGVAALLLAVWEQRAEEPLLPPSLFANRTVMLCSIVLGMNFLVLYGTTIMAPLALQTIGAVPAGTVALYMLPLTLGVPVGSYYSGKGMQTAMRERLLLGLGSLLCGVGAATMAIGSLQAGPQLALALGVTGFGIGLCIPASIVAVQAAVAPPQIGIATATSGVFRTLGGGIGIALMSAVLFASLVTPEGASSALIGDQNTAVQLAKVPIPSLQVGFKRVFALAAATALLAALLTRLLGPTKAHT